MKIRNKIALLFVVLCSIVLVACQETPQDDVVEKIVGETIYVSTTGSVDGTGSKENPKEFTTALINAQPGDTILVAGGTYSYTSRIGLANSGVYNGYITVKAENPEERVILDFSRMFFNGSNRGIQIYGDFWHFLNIEITGAGDNGMYIAGNYNIIENCLFYNNRDSGLQIGRGYSDETSIDQWPSFNLIKNCTSFGNYDGETYGENADGFAAKLTVGFGNVFDGCIAFRNSDDGWDLYAKEDSGNIGTVSLYNCVSFENGFLPYQIERPADDASGTTYMSYDTMNGDGIGFKLGGSTMEGDVVLRNCLAFNNKLHGFGDNSNPGVIDIRNCTAFNNCIGLTEDGDVKAIRGIDGLDNKSNNYDLARSTKSYNNYYGLLSYINNQSGFAASNGESSYNADAFRGSAAYSIFQPEYAQGKEKYVAFTGYEDASSYSSEFTDPTFSVGTPFNGMNDSCFASLESVNAKCSSVDTINTLISYHTQFRNSDFSVNMGDLLKVVDPTLLTFANGEQVGANLSKGSYAEYTHYDVLTFDKCKNADEAKVMAAYNSLDILASEKSIFQDFEITKWIDEVDITWTSSNTDIIEIDKLEEVSLSKSIYATAKVRIPQEETTVTLTAKLSYGSAAMVKTFELIVKDRNQSLGKLVSTGGDTVRVPIYNIYSAPRVYALDSSSNTVTELAASSYTLSYEYYYAEDGNSKFNKVDNVYTSVPGLYRVVVTAKSTIDDSTSSLTYNVYVVDPDCMIDFINSESTVSIDRDGYTISGELSNVYGDVYSVVSSVPLTNVTAQTILNHDSVQKVEITDDEIQAKFIADNNTGEMYYGYYIVANKNTNQTSRVYSFATNVQAVSTHQEFNNLASYGTTKTEKTAEISGVDKVINVYSLTKDLDFSDYTWSIPTTGESMKSLFNGNNHTISNLTIEGSSSTKNINMFYKVSYGTIMNVKFENITIINHDTSKGLVGIIGDLQGGYIHNIKMVNITAKGRESVGALVGQVTGQTNYISQCSLVNDESCVISAGNKYAGGIVGNGQKNSDQPYLKLHVSDCYVKATIGDGNDAAGNTGGIVGRVKNEFNTYETLVERCYYEGTIIAKGNYNAGIVGDFDCGLGKVTIRHNISLVKFIFKGEVLDAYEAQLAYAEQEYAHKNTNPIVGRSVWAEGGIYDTSYNYGTWREYYQQYINSYSIVFDLGGFDEDSGDLYVWKISREFVLNGLKLDLENVWLFDDATSTLTLR